MRRKIRLNILLRLEYMEIRTAFGTRVEIFALFFPNFSKAVLQCFQVSTAFRIVTNNKYSIDVIIHIHIQNA